MSSIPIFYGPRMADYKPPQGEKRRPTTWSLGFRAQAPMVDAVELLAKQNNCGVADILRSATAEFIAKYAGTTSDNIQARLTAHQSAREAQINAGLVPKTSNPRNSTQSHHNPSGEEFNLKDQTQKPHQQKRGGMKDKISSL